MLTFTDRAQEMVRNFISQSDGELQSLRIQVEGGSPLAPAFELTLVATADRDPDDLSVDGGGFEVFIDPRSAERLEGATVDFVERVNERGFEIRPVAGANGAAAPTGELAERVQAVLEQQVNPQIASHGGRIDLVGVEGTEVLMEMSGGCQGCAMSRMTLRQGVERMIREAIPEVTAIHDVTDHSAGDNPYFQA
ncbi:MAG: NifU family protein [Gemmatimonadota bacterium]